MCRRKKRLDLIHRLQAKYGDSIPAIKEYKARAESRLEALLHFDERMEELKAKRGPSGCAAERRLREAHSSS